ncbi:hypothetical protein SAMN05421544_10733 [Riemerella columbipharyngis]|uniref:Thioredoxin-like fold domain-containing protein n=2 Tax=Riemerella columbipharyngis TaxID=1071918 RepID=A0A1G7C2K4_9FLAO|nr:hypothetical protein SAMN05421544_10733 [Riemerella columbipharyngis]
MFQWCCTQVPLDSLDGIMKREPRYILMNIRSKNCVYCLMQMKRLNKDKDLMRQLNENVYFVEWELEAQPDFSFGGRLFSKNKSAGRYPGEKFIDVYLQEVKGEIGYPLWFVFDKNYNFIYHYFGLLPNKSIMEMVEVLLRQENEK